MVQCGGEPCPLVIEYNNSIRLLIPKQLQLVCALQSLGVTRSARRLAGGSDAVGRRVCWYNGCGSAARGGILGFGVVCEDADWVKCAKLRCIRNYKLMRAIRIIDKMETPGGHMAKNGDRITKPVGKRARKKAHYETQRPRKSHQKHTRKKKPKKKRKEKKREKKKPQIPPLGKRITTPHSPTTHPTPTPSLSASPYPPATPSTSPHPPPRPQAHPGSTASY